MPRELDDDMHFRILRILQDRPEISQRELARELGVAVGKTNYVLNALTEKGFPEMQNFRNSQIRLRYAYILTPVGISRRAKMTMDFLQRKSAEFEHLQAEIAAVRRVF